MRKRCHNPPVPARVQHNVVGVALSPSPQTPGISSLTVTEITGDAPCPLSKLAWFIWQMTNSFQQENLVDIISAAAPIRDESSLFLRCDSFPPMYSFPTNWRDTNICAANFGFAKPAAFRYIMNFVTPGLMVVCPPRTDDPGSDEGPEFCIAFENELRDELLNDPDWCKYFDFRGIDSEEI